MNIAEYLPKGKENAIHLEQLTRTLNMSETTVKGLIREARRQGVPIMSAKCGYWLSESKEEHEAFIKSMRAHGFSMIKTASSFVENEEIKGQIKL